MKLKLFILLGILTFSAGVFAQKTETAKPAETKSAEPKSTPAPVAKLPTVKEILDKYVAAIGGREANEKIKTRMTKGLIEMSPMGIKGTVESYSAAPNKNYMKLNIGGIGEIIDGFDGTAGWSINPIQGNRDKEGDELLQAKLTYTFSREVNLDKIYSKIEVKGTDKVGDKDVYVVTATPAGLPAETLYFDTKSGMLLRSDVTAISPEGNMMTKNFFDDFREVDGVKIPFKTRSVLPQFEMNMTLTEIKHGVTIDDKIFSKPKQ